MGFVADLVYLSALAIVLLSAAQTAPAPRDPFPPKRTSFPSVTYACKALTLPSDQSAAKDAIASAQSMWIEAAVAVKLEKGSPLFVDGTFKSDPQSTNQTPIAARICSIVPSGSNLLGFEMQVMSPRSGVAGFCPQTDVDTCLASAASKAGYSDIHPWTKLPLYIRWAIDAPVPATAAETVTLLATNMVSILSLSPPETREQSSNGLKQLVTCIGNNCPKRPQTLTVPVAGPGIGWFIPDSDP